MLHGKRGKKVPSLWETSIKFKSKFGSDILVHKSAAAARVSHCLEEEEKIRNRAMSDVHKSEARENVETKAVEKRQ